jgi:hypothetical protein
MYLIFSMAGVKLVRGVAICDLPDDLIRLEEEGQQVNRPPLLL